MVIPFFGRNFLSIPPVPSLSEIMTGVCCVHEDTLSERISARLLQNYTIVLVDSELLSNLYPTNPIFPL